MTENCSLNSRVCQQHNRFHWFLTYFGLCSGSGGDLRAEPTVTGCELHPHLQPPLWLLVDWAQNTERGVRFISIPFVSFVLILRAWRRNNVRNKVRDGAMVWNCNYTSAAFIASLKTDANSDEISSPPSTDICRRLPSAVQSLTSPLHTWEGCLQRSTQAAVDDFSLHYVGSTCKRFICDLVEVSSRSECWNRLWSWWSVIFAFLLSVKTLGLTGLQSAFLGWNLGSGPRSNHFIFTIGSHASRWGWRPCGGSNFGFTLTSAAAQGVQMLCGLEKQNPTPRLGSDLWADCPLSSWMLISLFVADLQLKYQQTDLSFPDGLHVTIWWWGGLCLNFIFLLILWKQLLELFHLKQTVTKDKKNHAAITGKLLIESRSAGLEDSAAPMLWQAFMPSLPSKSSSLRATVKCSVRMDGCKVFQLFFFFFPLRTLQKGKSLSSACKKMFILVGVLSRSVCDASSFRGWTSDHRYNSLSAKGCHNMVKIRIYFWDYSVKCAEKSLQKSNGKRLDEAQFCGEAD